MSRPGRSQSRGPRRCPQAELAADARVMETFAASAQAEDPAADRRITRAGRARATTFAASAPAEDQAQR